MPRYRRQTEFGSIQHVISRFVGHKFLLDHPGAREEYLGRVSGALKRSDWHLLAFALMSNHVHWVMRAGATSSSAFIKPLHSGFANWFNRATCGLGPVFADRHRTVACQGDNVAALIAYVHNNPVRACVVREPSRSTWTSHRAYLGLDTAPVWLHVELGLHLCDFEATATGRLRFDEYVRARATEPRSATLNSSNLERHRTAARLAASNPVELSTPRVRSVGGMTGLEISVFVPPLCPPRTTWRGSPLTVVGAVASEVGLCSELVRSRRRTRSLTAARRLALLIWCSEFSRPTQEMARALGIGASAACGLIARARADERTRAAQVALALRQADANAPKSE